MLDRAEIVAACFRQVFMEGGQSCPQPPFRRPAAFAGDSGGAGKLTNYQKLAGDPQLWARAPGRVDLMGSHTDYNLGFVLTLPIGRDTWIAARRRDDGIVRVHSMNLDASDEFRLDAIEPVSESRWRNYVRGVAAILQNEGLALTGCDAIIHSTVPVAAGLSSSAALECALATLFSGLGGWSLTGERKALLCQKAENQFVGVNCGILDQYSSCLGRENHALLLDCRDLSYKLAPIPDHVALVIANTMVKHSVAGGDYPTRRRESEAACAVIAMHRPGVPFLRDATLEDLEKWGHEMEPKSLMRAKHVISEDLRTVAACDALLRGDMKELGRLMAEAHRSYSRDFEGSCAEADALVELAEDLPGLIGARLTGGGFGGCTINLVEQSEAAKFAEALGVHYAARTGITPQIHICHASGGAHRLE